MLDETAQSTSEPDYPWPPRYWWTKRLALAGVVVLALLALARLWWGYAAAKPYEAMLEKYRAAGEPVAVEDLNAPPIPDAQNAAFYLRKAAAAINAAAPSPSQTNMRFNSYPPFSQWWINTAANAERVNAAALALAREARQFERAQWTATYASPLMNVMLTHLNSQRQLANLISDSAMLAHVRANDAEALQQFQDLLHIADSVDQEPVLVCHLVSLGIRALATERLQSIAPVLRIEGDPTVPYARDASPASRQQVEQLIALMLDETSQREGHSRALLGERLMTLDLSQVLRERASLLQPFHRLAAVEYLDVFDDLREALDEPTVPAVQQAAAPVQAKLNDSLLGILAPSLERATVTDHRVRMERRMTAVSLAVRLYRADHDGRWPQALDELVPGYLPSVPLDSNAPGEQPLRYILAEGGTRPIVYGVDENGTDDTTSQTTFPNTPMWGYQQKQPDQWRDLSHVKVLTTPPPDPQPDPEDEMLP